VSVQVIERNGKPEWAVLPYEDYLQLVEQAEMLQDIQEFDRARAAVDSGEDEVLPAEVVYALVDGENPVRVWREFRQLTQQQLAEQIGISVPFLSQIETGKRKASTKVLAGLAKTLRVALDDLVTGL
jgi:DNA-binding XRE family transcriptional regulator